MSNNIRVKLKQRSYSISVGFQILDKLSQNISRLAFGQRLFVVYDAQVFALHGNIIEKYLKRSRICFESVVVPASEKVKSPAELQHLYDWLLSLKVARGDFILAVGGGTISDLTGYLAATTLRGLNWGVVSTTLLGMVDAAIGGKTGINHKFGKNLIGAFWQPGFVICDTCFLQTLPQRQILNGLGEVAKYAGLMGEAMSKPLRRYLSRGDLYNQSSLKRLVSLSARYKAQIVADDEREGGRRMILNLGHTFGHGIEASLKFNKLFHGEAVILGLWAASDLSARMYPEKTGWAGEYQQLLEGLMHAIPRVRIDTDSVLSSMRLDKKRSKADQSKYVLLESPGSPIIVEDVPRAKVRAALLRMLKRYESAGGTDANNIDRQRT